jgi:predicted CxxxxCH...CXXCH cytochrome family protein
MKQSIGVLQDRIRGSRAMAIPVAVLAGIGLLVVSGCASQEGEGARSAAVRKVPRLSAAPANPRMMQVYFDTGNGREWIYDGVRWLPHDATIDDVEREPAQEGAGRAQPSASLTVPFSPTGAHAKHRAFACAACHLVGGSPCLDPAGPAAAAGKPPPGFDPVAKTCSNVACHGMYSGNYTYGRWDYGIDDVVYVTVPYSGSGGTTPSWFSTGSTCTSCHGNPPAPTGAWHSSTHATTMPTGRNCEICHLSATSAVVGGKVVGVAIKAAYASTHGDGVVNVQPKFTSKCFGCH